jgi:hypothetical protein
MASGDLLPANPVSLADREALQVFKQSDSFAEQPEDHRLLRELDASATSLDFVDKNYWAETSRGMSIPASFEADEQVPIINFFKLAFEGKFVCYSKLQIGRIVGHGSVKALCLTFDEATLLPYLDPLPATDLLYVPVLAVDEINPTGIAA